jgi:hypothetical protein
MGSHTLKPGIHETLGSASTSKVHSLTLRQSNLQLTVFPAALDRALSKLRALSAMTAK